MKDIIEIIKTRRCVREYKEDQISDADIKFLIECAGYAPSGLNMQPWGFLVIKNKEVMHRLSEIGKKTMIPLLIIILGDNNAPTAAYDCSVAAQTMMLATWCARSGLGEVNLIKQLFFQLADMVMRKPDRLRKLITAKAGFHYHKRPAK